MRGLIRRRLDNWLRTGAALDAEGLRFIRRARWWMPPFGVLMLILAWMDDRWFAVALFGGLGVCTLFFSWPATLVMLRGYANREHIDISEGVEGFDASAITTGAAAGVALVPLSKWLVETWPWW